MATSALSVAFLQQSDYVGGATFVAIADGLLVVATLLALGLTPLYLPSYAEVSRVIEDCR